MRDTRKRSDKCEGSNLSNTQNEKDILTGNTYCRDSAEKSRTELSSTRISLLSEGLPMADELVTDYGKHYHRNDKTRENILNQLICDDNYATGLMLRPTILPSRKNEQLCWCRKNRSVQQILTRIARTSSTDISQSITYDNRHRRTSHLRYKMPDWVKATALLYIIFLTSCNALPTNRGSKQNSAVHPANDFDDVTSILSNGTGRSRNGRSSDFSQHMGVQRLYNNFNGFYLEVKRNGKVIGTRNGESPYTDIKFKSLRRGRVALYFPKAGRYLSMNKRKLSSEVVHTDECCSFKESYDPDDLYFTYESASSKSKKGRKKHRYIAIKGKRRSKSKKSKAATVSRINKLALFQKVRSKHVIEAGKK